MQKQYSSKKEKTTTPLGRAFGLTTAIGLLAIGCASKSPFVRKPTFLEPPPVVKGFEYRESKKLKIISFTGQVQIKLGDGSIIGVVPGAPVPEIPSNAEVIVVSGMAVFDHRGVIVTASRGESFYFYQKKDKYKITSTGSSEIRVSRRDGKQVTLFPGESTSGEFKAIKKAKLSQLKPPKNRMNMTVLSFGGQIQVRLDDGSLITMVQGAPVFGIPAGSRVTVISGFAMFEAGGMRVGADKGESFRYDAGKSVTGITALDVKKSISIVVGRAEQVKLKQGESVVIEPYGKDYAIVTLGTNNGKGVKRKMVRIPNLFG